MALKKYHAADRTYKFIYKVLGIEFHRYLYDEGESIKFIDNEIPDTGQRRDITTEVDGKFIRTTEFLSTALYDDKLYSMYDYHQDLRHDHNNEGLEVRSNVVTTANPNWGHNKVDVDSNITFHVDTIYIQKMNGWEILNNIINKTITQEELSKKEAIHLLLLPDMEMEMRSKSFLKLICFLVFHTNIPDEDFRKKIIYCEVKVLERFITDEEITEMIDMFKYDTDIPERRRIIEKYGRGFDEIYFDGKYDGIIETKIENARNLLAKGVNEETVSECINLSIEKIKEIKRKL